MPKLRRKRNSGWSLLEASLALALTLGAISVGFAIIQYAWAMRTVEATLDRVIFDSAVKPFALRSDGGSLQVDVRARALEQAVTGMADTAAASLAEDLKVDGGDNSRRYLVEIAYARVNIDSSSGAGGGISVAPFSFVRGRGNPQLAQHADDNRLDSAFERRSRETSQYPGAMDSPISRYAVPVGIFGDTQQTRFLPAAILLGGRAVFSLEGTFVGNLLEGIGLPPFISALKVVNLRGELQ